MHVCMCVCASMCESIQSIVYNPQIFAPYSQYFLHFQLNVPPVGRAKLWDNTPNSYLASILVFNVNLSVKSIEVFK